MLSKTTQLFVIIVSLNKHSAALFRLTDARWVAELNAGFCLNTSARNMKIIPFPQCGMEPTIVTLTLGCCTATPLRLCNKYVYYNYVNKLATTSHYYHKLLSKSQSSIKAK